VRVAVRLPWFCASYEPNGIAPVLAEGCGLDGR